MIPALEIARRELKDNLATWKLPLTLALTVLMLLAGVLSLSASHQEDVDAHDLVQDEYLARNETNTPEALAHRFLGRPNTLSLLVGGPGESVRAAVASAPVVTNESARASQDPLRLRFAPTDLETIAVVALSLLAILVAYDAISGEKERGTLKILLLNPLGRLEVLVGKYLGAMLTILIPLAIALALALPALYAAGIRFSAPEWGRLGAVLLVLVLFLSSIVLLAVAVSALTTRTAVSILALSLLWLLLVAAAGSVASFAATADPSGRGADEMLQEMRLLHDAYDEEEAGVRAEILRLESLNATQGALSPQDEARLRGLREDLLDLSVQRVQDQQALLASYLRGREADAGRAERFAMISPAEAFRSAAQRLARTDHQAAQERLDEFSAYLREIAELEAEAKAANRTFEPPAFRSAPTSLGRDVGRAAPFLASLAVANGLALGGAVLAFRRYDVR